MLEEKDQVVAENVETEELFEHYNIVADPKQTPIRIDKFLMDRIPAASRNRIQNAIRSGAVLVDEKNIKPNFKIKPGHAISIVFPKPPKTKGVIPQDIPLDIRYEDEDLMIIHKPVGMVVHPGVGVHDGTLVNALAFYFQNLNLPVQEGNGEDRPGLVHRIDKDTSGLMVIAKNEFSMTHLGKQFFNHTIKRKYQALVWGEPDDDEGTIDAPIGRHPKNRILRYVFDEEDGEGKRAVTHFKVLERLYYVSLIECQLETGRTHQIRVHMKHIGHRLFNDERYGGHRIMKGTVYTKYKQFVQNCFKLCPRQALHAKSIGFVHPRTGEDMYFESDLPDDFQNVLDKWRSYLAGRKEVK